jgi:hypothetical protein
MAGLSIPFRYFSLDELKEKSEVVKKYTYNHRKWKRLIEIYAIHV